MKRYVAILGMIALVGFSSCKVVRALRLFRSARQQIEQSPVAGVIRVPFNYDGGWITLKMRVRQGANSIEGSFLFDTGAFTRLFDSCGGIRISQPKNVSRIPVAGALGSSWKELKIAENVSLQSGPIAVLKPKLLVSDRPSFFPKHWLGIIGTDLFRHHILTIDFEHQMLLMHPAGSFPAQGLPNLGLKTIGHYNPVVRGLHLGDLGPMDYLVDVGNNGSVLIQQRDAAALRRAMGGDVRVYAIKQDVAHDASGRMLVSDYFIKTARQLNGMPCPEYEVAGLINDVGRNQYGNLGLAFLNRVFASITIDLDRRLFYYKINTRATPIDRFDREVYFNIADSTYHTGPVLIQSHWYQQGLRPGMQVILINGDHPSIYLKDRKAGNVVQLNAIGIRVGDSTKMMMRKD